MTHLLVQARFNRTTLLPEDLVLNTFHFATPGTGPVTGAEALSAMQRVVTFYTTPPVAGGNAVGTAYSTVLDSGLHELRSYDQSQPIPRIPVASLFFGLPVRSGAQPSEVSVVLSISAARPAGAPAGRYRGRIYLGPWGSSIQGPVSAGDSRPGAAWRTVIGQAGQRLADLSAPIKWCVYSPTDLALRPIDRCCVDDAFDTIRSRGATATLKDCFLSPLPV